MLTATYTRRRRGGYVVAPSDCRTRVGFCQASLDACCTMSGPALGNTHDLKRTQTRVRRGPGSYDATTDGAPFTKCSRARGEGRPLTFTKRKERGYDWFRRVRDGEG